MVGRNDANARRRALRAVPLTALVTALLGLLGASSASAAPRDLFGVMSQTALTTQDYQLMGDAKVGTHRFEIPWAQVDPTPAPNDYNFGGVDTVMTQLATEGIEPLPFIFTTPEWAVKLDGGACGKRCAIYAPHKPAGLAAWKTFVSDVVERYGPGGVFWQQNPNLPENPVHEWQIWNEQNSPSFYGPKPNVPAYAKLLKASDSAIAAADPTAEVIVGGMFGTPLGGRKPGRAAWDFLGRLYDVKGIKRAFDGLGIHPYAAQMKKVIGQIDLWREEITAARDPNVDLWLTEIGWASTGPTNPLVRGAAGQAKRLREAFDYFLQNRRKLNFRVIIWYSWRDRPADDTICEWCPGSGLLTESRAKKPSYTAFTSYTGGS